MTQLSCHALSFHRGQALVLDQVGFVSDKPELIGIIGPNGAGKTTLMRCLAGLLSPTSGAVALNGQALDRQSITAKAKAIAFLPQERSVHWSLQCQDIVMLGRMPHRSAFARPSEKDRKIVADAMQQMDVSAFANRDFLCLSGGEQARVLIARMLAQEPDLMIADEPVNGLDPAHQISLMQILRAIVAKGTRVLVSLHDLSLASRWCDRLLLVHQGRLVADNSPNIVLSDDNMASVFGIGMGHLACQDRIISIPTHLVTSCSSHGSLTEGQTHDR